MPGGMRRLALLAALGLSACCVESTSESGADFVVDPADPAHADAVDRCFADDAACERLCMDLLGPPPAGTTRLISECYLDEQDDGLLLVHATSLLTQKCYGDGSAP